ncbi:hypothetical protein MHM84_01845 [Halomonas sp. McH1-25]|uniref:hypothetical protein n=1 Tax=unclassified Halomonas TaxID=2609666 RepID=UPI001EF5FB24|nr:MULTISPECIES: hypothetical protein [unclassified Halomonas]MCG7598526.1 hypothetical protein [Halomonas sp. McH1-25]MCP1341778.1 hypothetical protein [Halomonas sp. FL8]MCP1360995.1 hypothetical protein [Halomonas sp. BBD45]MCP1364498.1 hypothetical protein [Halomonas sp. BBD48]
MLTHKQRTLLIASAWLMALTAAPYATLVIYQYGDYDPDGFLAGPGVFASGIVLFTAAILVLTLLVTKLSSELDDIEKASRLASPTSTAHNRRQRDSLLPEGRDSGLRLLRMAKDSPIKGKVAAKAIILSINGQQPASAAEANEALKHGDNRVEWADNKGNVHSTTFYCQKHDLKAQFEQITRVRESTRSSG